MPFFQIDGQLYVERQANNGLRLWVENFRQVEVIACRSARLLPEGWIPWDDRQPWTKRISFVFVPEEFRPARFLSSLPSARVLIRDSIARNEFLCFAIGGLFGDWGAVAAREAIRMGRPYSIWTDRVESDVVRRTIADGSWKRRLQARLTHRPMAALERYLIRHADLGLFHGSDTYESYAPFSPNPKLVHNVHISKNEQIEQEKLAAKQDLIRSVSPEIIYAGRMASMKGWSDWLDVIVQLRRSNMRFRATWLGGGGDLGSFHRKVEDLGLADIVSAPGNIDDREEVRRRLEAAHVLLFCHKTKESPRVLIEALRSGTPIVGYRGAYAEDLISRAGGGVLTPADDIERLAQALLSLDGDRGHWASLMSKARKDGEDLYDEAVFRHRSETIKTSLARAEKQSSAAASS